METKHALKTKVGIKEKKIHDLEAQLAVDPKSASGEAFKESVRMLVSLLVGTLVAWVYSKYPIMGQLQPDQTAWVVVITSLTVRGLDKYVYQFFKNEGKATKGVGIDYAFYTLGHLFDRSKTAIEQAEVKS